MKDDTVVEEEVVEVSPPSLPYAKVEDGQVVSTNIPEVGELPDGSQVSGFNRLPPEDLAQLGWFPLDGVDPPDFDPETHFATPSFEVLDDRVVQNWDVEKHPDPLPPEPSLEDRITALEKEVAKLKSPVIP